MDNEPYRDLTHLELIATVSDWVRSQGHQVTNEHRLPDGRVADVIYLADGGSINIIECKVVYNQTLIDQAYDKYYQWCNRLWVASNRRARFETSGATSSLDFAEGARIVGLIEVGRDRLAIEKTAMFHNLDRENAWRVRVGLPKAPPADGPSGPRTA
jgi:hypothetical protein